MLRKERAANSDSVVAQSPGQPGPMDPPNAPEDRGISPVRSKKKMKAGVSPVRSKKKMKAGGLVL